MPEIGLYPPVSTPEIGLYPPVATPVTGRFNLFVETNPLIFFSFLPIIYYSVI